MKHNSYFQIVSSIGRNRGGLTKALYDRSFAISEIGAQTKYVLPFMQVDAEEIFLEVQSTQKLSADSILLSIYKDLSTKRGQTGEKVGYLYNFDKVMKTAIKTVEPHASGSTVRHFQDGMFLGVSSYNTRNELTAITYHDPAEPWKPIAKDAFSPEGNIIQRTYLDPTFSARYRIYYSPTGQAIMSHWISLTEKLYRVVIYGRNGEGHQFETMEAAQIWWLDDCISAHSPVSVISDEPSTLAFLKMEGKTARPKSIAAIHTTHLKDQIEKKEFKSWFAEYTSLQSSIDNFVVFTHAQLTDIVMDGKIPSNKCCVISHPAPASKYEHGKKSGIVTVSRLDKFKRIDDSIRAFGNIANEFQDVNYDIYGSGPEEQSLLALIKKLNLENRVFLHGYTDDALNCFSKACLSLFTSRYEGFGISLLESMSQCCPVLSYSVKYGPMEIIEDGVNGVLVENGDIQELSSALRDLLGNPKKLQRLANNCVEISSRYNIVDWKRDWVNLLLSPRQTG